MPWWTNATIGASQGQRHPRVIGAFAVVGITYDTVEVIVDKGVSGWWYTGIEAWVFVLFVVTVLGGVAPTPFRPTAVPP